MGHHEFITERRTFTATSQSGGRAAERTGDEDLVAHLRAAAVDRSTTGALPHHGDGHRDVTTLGEIAPTIGQLVTIDASAMPR